MKTQNLTVAPEALTDLAVEDLTVAPAPEAQEDHSEVLERVLEETTANAPRPDAVPAGWKLLPARKGRRVRISRKWMKDPKKNKPWVVTSPDGYERTAHEVIFQGEIRLVAEPKGKTGCGKTAALGWMETDGPILIRE